MPQQLEIRYLTAHALRAVKEDGKAPRLQGYAAVFNSLSLDLGGFQERILPGAFKATLASGYDFLALAHHDYQDILARTSAGTLKLAEDDQGLAVDIGLPDTSIGRDALANVNCKNITAMSFAFWVPDGGDRWTMEGDTHVRELLAVNLDEVSIVIRPAYPETSVAVRDHVKALAGKGTSTSGGGGGGNLAVPAIINVNEYWAQRRRQFEAE